MCVYVCVCVCVCVRVRVYSLRPPSPSLFSTFAVLLPHTHTCMHVVTYSLTHAQHGNTALKLACLNKHEAAAGELMEVTKLAGALDRQVAHAA